MTRKPDEVLAIHDNGGETPDRYTIVLNERNGDSYTMLGLSDNPEHPQGISQFTEGVLGDHLGHEIDWTLLPDELKEHVVRRVRGE